MDRGTDWKWIVCSCRMKKNVETRNDNVANTIFVIREMSLDDSLRGRFNIYKRRNRLKELLAQGFTCQVIMHFSPST